MRYQNDLQKIRKWLPTRIWINRHFSTCTGTNPAEDSRLQDIDLEQLVNELENGDLSPECRTYATLLRRCAASKDTEQGRRVHTHIIENQHVCPDVFLLNAVVEMYGKSGDLERAKLVFDSMEVRNSYSWNVMVAAYAQRGHPQDTMRMFQTMALEGGMPYKHSYSNFLTVCSALDALPQARDIYPDLVAHGLYNHVIVGTALINLYGRSGFIDEAHEVFESITNKDVISWSSMISVFARGGHHKLAMTLYRRMLLEGVAPEEITLVSLMTACTVEEGREIHLFALANGFKVDEILGGSLVNLYGKYGELEAARVLHDSMESRNVVSYTALIASYVQRGYPENALEEYRRMDHEGIKLNAVTFTNLLGACSGSASLGAGIAIHSRLVETGYHPDDVLGTALVNMYGKCGSIGDAKRVFDSMCMKDTVAWNAMMAAFVHIGHYEDACEMFLRLHLEGLKPDDGTFVSSLDACGELDNLKLGKRVHAWITGTWYEQDEKIASALVNMYGKCGALSDVERMCKSRSSLVVLNALAAAYAQLGRNDKAMWVCRRIDLEGLKFDEATFVSAFCACSLLLDGDSFHRRLLESRLNCNVTVWNSLINMYGRCGSPDDARKVFNSVPDQSRDLITWNVMFAAYAQGGYHTHESVKLLQEMDLQGVRGDEITVVNILVACGTSGSLEDSKRMHERASARGMESGDTVGGLLVNAYGKCGSLESARSLFQKMKLKNLFTWTALLAGYAQHGHGKEALEVYQMMSAEGLKPSDVTFISILFACSHAGLLEEGRMYFLSMIEDYGITAVEDHYKCMLDLLARVGLLSEAEELLEEMPCDADYLSWMTLLAACKVHSDFGRADRAAENATMLQPGNATPSILIANMHS